MAQAVKEVVEFGAKVSKADYEEFKKNFPQYGAVNWFINSTLQQFNKQVSENPSNKDLIDAAIKQMLEDNRTTEES